MRDARWLDTWCARTVVLHECAGPFARWTSEMNGSVTVLCQEWLNAWLDVADEDPDMEPARLEFL